MGGLLLLVGCSDAPLDTDANTEAPQQVLKTGFLDAQSAGADDSRMVLRGQLVYRSRVALVPNSQTLIELRKVSGAIQTDHAVVAEQWIIGVR
jgi:uncharacterized lipoprotein YbaY